MNKTIFITGSTDGIGKLAAIKLAKEGHTIYIHGRSLQKVNKTIAEIKELSFNDNINGFVADFSDLEEVKQLVVEVNKTILKLDVLINNAGVFKSTISKNKDGIDIRFVVNYLAPYILTKELIPTLKKGVAPRVINLSSAAQSTVSLEVLMGNQDIPAQEAYAQSKLALTIWSFDLAQKTNDIAVIAVNPGSLLNTKMVSEAYGRYWSSADKGANILYDLAILEEHKKMTGKYFDNDKGDYGQAHTDAYNVDKTIKLISLTERVLSKIS